MSNPIVAAFRDLTDRKDVVFNGPGSFVIGLSSDGSIVVDLEESPDAVCVILLKLTVSPSGGYVLAPANYDLPCLVNESEELTGEINLIDGTRLEVANKILVFIDGPIPVRRRTLPRTPGMPLDGGPPAKPSRASLTGNQDPFEEAVQELNSSLHYKIDNGDSDEDDDDDDDDSDRRWLDTSWCKLDMPTAEQQLFADLTTPEQISIVAASYFCKQLRLFTDANSTTQLLDDIFKLFKDSVVICKDTFLDYLSDISRIIQKNPHRSQTRPMHGPAIKLLNELLRQLQDSLSDVILLLDLMRTFSHFDSNMNTMVRHQVAVTVAACMSPYYDVVEVQLYGLDTLARIAKFRPVIDKKAPLREAAIDIMLKAEHQHHKDLSICRALCRALANLAESLTEVTNILLDKESAVNPAVRDAVKRYEECLLFMFKRSLPVVQTILDDHGSDLGVRTEGRKFVYYYAKLPQLQQKKTVWLESLEDERDETVEIYRRDEPDSETPAIKDLKAYPDVEKETKGILKKVGSFENLREPGKKIVFADTTVGGSASDTDSSDDEMFAGPFPEPKIPTEIEPDKQFQPHIMKALIGKTFGKTDFLSEDSCTSNSSDSSDDGCILIMPQKQRKKRSVKTRNKSKPIGYATQNNGAKTDVFETQKKDEKGAGTQVKDQMIESETKKETNIAQQFEAETRRVTIEDATELKFVDDHYRNSFNQRDAVVNNSENGQTENTEPDSYFEIALNNFHETVLSCSPQQCHTDETNSILVESIRNIGDNEFNMVSEIHFTESAENKDISAVQDEKYDHEKLTEKFEEFQPDIKNNLLSACDTNGAIFNTTEPKKESSHVNGTDENIQMKNEIPARTSFGKIDSCIMDVPFMGKLVRTQIIVHVGSLVFQGDDSKVLLVIDQPITELLEHAAAPAGLVDFARNQYGADMTLMDLEPSIVISAIDAVRYRNKDRHKTSDEFETRADWIETLVAIATNNSKEKRRQPVYYAIFNRIFSIFVGKKNRSVTADLVHKAVLSLTRAITHKLQPPTINITMLFYKALFADENLQSVVTEKEFVKEFKTCFSNATERLNSSHSIEEIRAKLSSPSFVV